MNGGLDARWADPRAVTPCAETGYGPVLARVAEGVALAGDLHHADSAAGEPTAVRHPEPQERTVLLRARHNDAVPSRGGGMRVRDRQQP